MVAKKKEIDSILREFKSEIEYQTTNIVCQYSRPIKIKFAKLYEAGADADYIRTALGISLVTLLRWHRIYLFSELEEPGSNMFETKEECDARESYYKDEKTNDGDDLAASLDFEVQEIASESEEDEWEKENDIVKIHKNWVLEGSNGTSPMQFNSPSGYSLVLFDEAQAVRLMKGVNSTPD